MNVEKHKLIKHLSIRNYLKGRSIFRDYQDLFLERFGPELSGDVIEIGGEKHYNHQRFFKHSSSYTCSNVDRDYDVFLDITKTDFEDNSQSNYVCVSVLEHIFDIRKAFQEIERTLKPGGKILITIPFAYPYHDSVDYWRLSIDSYYKLLAHFEIIEFVHLGGLFSSIAENLHRPRTKWRLRFFVYKMLGLLMLVIGKKMERRDGFPLGYGVFAKKK